MDVIKQIDYMIACLEMAKEEYQYKKSYETKKKARDTITITLEDYEHIGAVFNSLPIRERHKNLKKQDVALYRCPKCGNYIAEWTEVCECGNRLDWGESEDLHVNNDKR